MNPFLRLTACGLAAYVLALPVAAHEGHDHGAEPVPTVKALPRAQAQSAEFELVAVAYPDRLVLHLDRFGTNEPVKGGKLEADFGSRKLVATERGEGAYEVPYASVAGRIEFTVAIEAADTVDLLPLALEVPADTAPATSRTTAWTGVAAAVAALLAMAAIAMRRRGSRAGLAGTVLLAAIAAGMPDAHADGSKGPAAAPAAEPPQRLPDGSVFLPKPAQRLFGIRTVVGEAGELARALEFKGHVLADPNAGGQVQATVGGRLEAGPKGLPVLGQRVARGEVLAWVTPARDPLARASARGQVAELEGRIDAAARRASRLEQLEGSVARRDIDNARIELDALRAQRRAIGSGLAEREPLAAPVAGVVSVANAVVGKVVEAREVLFEIVDPQRLVVEAVAYDAVAAAALVAGAPASAPDLGARLAFVGAGRALREQAIPLLFRFVPPVPPVATGQQVRVVAQTGVRVKGVPVPLAAMVRGGSGETVVWVHSSAERFEPRRVEALPLDATRVSVVKGLAGGERIVVEGATLLGQVR